jgi:hypothetical protein
MLLPPLMSTWENRHMCILEHTIGSRTRAYSPGLGISRGLSSHPPGDGCLRPMHELGFCRHNGVHLCLMPKVIPFILAEGGEDVVLLNIRWEVIILIRLASSRGMCWSS